MPLGSKRAAKYSLWVFFFVCLFFPFGLTYEPAFYHWTKERSMCALRKWRKAISQMHMCFICECHLAGKGLMWPGRLPNVMICRAHREEKELPRHQAQIQAETTEVMTFRRRQKRKERRGKEEKQIAWGNLRYTQKNTGMRAQTHGQSIQLNNHFIAG